jgi:hypothetical protein
MRMGLEATVGEYRIGRATRLPPGMQCFVFNNGCNPFDPGWSPLGGGGGCGGNNDGNGNGRRRDDDPRSYYGGVGYYGEEQRRATESKTAEELFKESRIEPIVPPVFQRESPAEMCGMSPLRVRARGGGLALFDDEVKVPLVRIDMEQGREHLQYLGSHTPRYYTGDDAREVFAHIVDSSQRGMAEARGPKTMGWVRDDEKEELELERYNRWVRNMHNSNEE